MDERALKIVKLPLRQELESVYGIEFDAKGKASCPSCRSSIPSLSVELMDEEWIWVCSKCGEMGNYISFVKMKERISEEEAFARIVNRHKGGAKTREVTPESTAIKPSGPKSTPCEIEPERKKTPTHCGILTVDEILKSSSIQRDIFLELLIERGCLSMLGGEQKIGKSLLALNIGISLAKGQDFLGLRVPRARKVLFFQQEIHFAGIRERLQKMTNLDDSLTRENLLFFPSDRILKITDKEDRQEIHRAVDTIHPDLLIFDPLCTFHNKNENDTSETNRVIDHFYELIQKYEIAVYVTHHVGKPSQVPRYGAHNLRGSSSIGDRPDSIMMLSRAAQLLANLKRSKLSAELRPTNCYANVEFVLRNDAAPEPFVIERNPETLWYTKSRLSEQLIEDVIPEKILESIRMHDGRIPQKELVELLEESVAGRGLIYEALRLMKKDGRVEHEKLPERGSPVVLWLP